MASLTRNGLGTTSLRLGAFGFGLIVVGFYLVTHPDTARPNLAMMVGLGALLLAAVLLTLVGSWAVRVRRGPRAASEIVLHGTNVNSGAVGLIGIGRPVETATDFVRKYEIRVDGQLVGQLGVGDSVLVTVPAGSHKLTATIGTNVSEPIDTVVAHGQTLDFITTATAGPLAYRRANHWLELHETTSAPDTDVV